MKKAVFRRTIDQIHRVSGRVIWRIIAPVATPILKDSCRARLILINQKGEILLVKNWISDGTWVLPGGGIKRKESAVNAVVRETREELGIKFSDHDAKKLLKIEPKMVESGGFRICMHPFWLQSHRRVDFKISRPALIDAKFFAFDDIPDDIAHGTRQLIDFCHMETKKATGLNHKNTQKPTKSRKSHKITVKKLRK